MVKFLASIHIYQIYNEIIIFISEQTNVNKQLKLTPMRDIGKALASGKLVWGDPCSEGSQTAKSGTDEQKIRSLYVSGDVIRGIIIWVSRHITAKPKEYKKVTM